MINVYIKEFIAICKYLEDHECRQKGNCFFVKREQLEYLLNQNLYETSKTKLQMWKGLRWLQADEKHLTKRIYNQQCHKYERIFVLDASVYQSLVLLSNETKVQGFQGGHINEK